MRRGYLLCLLLAACSQDPVRYIPEEDRRAAAADKATPISVSEMLANARHESLAPAAPSGRLLVHFQGDTVTPDPAQRASLWQFASNASAARQKLLVASRPGNFDDPGSPVLGQRRAVAVARELSAVVKDVEMRFDPALPPDVVVVTQGARP